MIHVVEEDSGVVNDLVGRVDEVVEDVGDIVQGVVIFDDIVDSIEPVFLGLSH